ncbi:hypothetical protein FA048_10995 [Pedobacter polaris]|uniref:Uncharacterized protein n=1 Tax=Pedobacter polaris TaxID=2571273 RepID=A0A4U1CSH6_9SPHI|nr:hypothetical protein [Pedobacter polaris]TKC10693.1 hypothetical protein FA048_10995 [Pedobacter polaris]
MRYINTSILVIDANWIATAKKDKYSPLWSSLKTAFESLVGKKCWYNESINDGTSNPIDHFRPKAAQVKKFTSKYATLDPAIWSQLFNTSQTGYPFLEFDDTNYRYACGFANSAHYRESIDGITRGKWDFFPIRSTSAIATTKAAITTEEIALLDPCDKNDPEYLCFNELGGIDASDGILTYSWEYCRVKVSIEVYNLMYSVISQKRLEKWVASEREIELLTVLFNRSNKTPLEQQTFDHLFINLITSLQKRSEYSAVVIDCIKNYIKRKDAIVYKWLHTEIPSDLLKK